MRQKTALAVCAAGAVAAATALASAPAASAADQASPAGSKSIYGKFKHLVVIYEENHSFDNLYGQWGSVNGQHVEGIADASTFHKRQIGEDGKPLPCLPQNDVNLVHRGPLNHQCNVALTTEPEDGVGRFPNWPFSIDKYIPATAKTCPEPGVFAPNGVKAGEGLPGGCTRDIVHRFYQEKFQVNHGKQNRYALGSDAMGLVMGHYTTKSLPIYKYLTSKSAPNYVIADHFFQAASGGSFLNHQWLIAARSPIDPTGGAYGGAVHSVLDTNGFPTTTPLYTPTLPGVVDGQLTQACGPDGKGAIRWLACGNYAINTVQPASPPFGTGPQIPLINDAKYPNIGDRLTNAGISWNWYSGGWDDAAAGHPGPVFQYHHQPFNYFANYAPGKPGRAHLQDETDFVASAKKGTLPTVSFVKPYGTENEHPGYASEPNGSDHLVDLLQAVTNGPDADETLVVVTYDEFGGQWDHVSPPGTNGSTPGVHDEMGPGSRIPALLVSSAFKQDGVDHTSYDTTSILASIERNFGLKPLSSRDARVNDLRKAVRAGIQGR